MKAEEITKMWKQQMNPFKLTHLEQHKAYMCDRLRLFILTKAAFKQCNLPAGNSHKTYVPFMRELFSAFVHLHHFDLLKQFLTQKNDAARSNL